MIILGIDPGTATTGFGVIKKEGKEIKVLDYGCIETLPGVCDGDRLKIISNKLNKIIKKYQPKVMAVETLFFFKNLKTVMPVSQAKGVILLSASKNKIPVYEFTPLQVKMTIANYGRAEKKQVQRMIQIMLCLEEKPEQKDRRKDDATDALGIALCYAFKKKIKTS